jgi:hypothetical protein
LVRGHEGLPVTTPARVQLRRVKGWRMPPNTVRVSRPSKFGNPFRVVRWGKSWGVLRAFGLGDTGQTVLGFGAGDLHPIAADARRMAVALYCEAIEQGRIAPDLAQLRGKNLACWCPPSEPCHADVLLRLANPVTPGAKSALLWLRNRNGDGVFGHGGRVLLAAGSWAPVMRATWNLLALHQLVESYDRQRLRVTPAGLALDLAGVAESCDGGRNGDDWGAA